MTTFFAALLLIILFVILIGLLVAVAVTLLFIFPMARGAVYVPSKDLAIETMIKLAKLKPNKLVADLGAGDGRITKAFAEAGAIAHGYEINPWLVFKGEQALRRAHLTDRAQIFRKSYWEVDLSDYEVITVYGITYIMAALEKKLLKELKPGTLVLSNYFQFPNWKITKTVNGIHVYQVPAKRK